MAETVRVDQDIRIAMTLRETYRFAWWVERDKDGRLFWLQPYWFVHSELNDGYGYFTTDEKRQRPLCKVDV